MSRGVARADFGEPVERLRRREPAARAQVESSARGRWRRLLGAAAAATIRFTSGATEVEQHACSTDSLAPRRPRRHERRVEHPSVVEAPLARELEAERRSRSRLGRARSGDGCVEASDDVLGADPAPGDAARVGDLGEQRDRRAAARSRRSSRRSVPGAGRPVPQSTRPRRWASGRIDLAARCGSTTCRLVGAQARRAEGHGRCCSRIRRRDARSPPLSAAAAARSEGLNAAAPRTSPASSASAVAARARPRIPELPDAGSSAYASAARSALAGPRRRRSSGLRLERGPGA